MTQPPTPALRYVRSFTSIVARADLDAAMKIYHDEFLPALAQAQAPHTSEVHLEVVADDAEDLEAVIHTRWPSLDALHEAMALETVGTSLLRMLLFDKTRPKVATYVVDAG